MDIAWIDQQGLPKSIGQGFVNAGRETRNHFCPLCICSIIFQKFSSQVDDENSWSFATPVLCASDNCELLLLPHSLKVIHNNDCDVHRSIGD